MKYFYIFLFALLACGQNDLELSENSNNTNLKDFNRSLPSSYLVPFKSSTSPALMIENVNFSMTDITKNKIFKTITNDRPFEYLKNKVYYCNYLKVYKELDNCDYDPMDELAMVVNRWDLESYAKWMDVDPKERKINQYQVVAEFTIKPSEFIDDLDSVQDIILEPVLYYPQLNVEQELDSRIISDFKISSSGHVVSFSEVVNLEQLELPILVFKVADFYVNEKSTHNSFSYKAKIKQTRDEFATLIVVTPSETTIDYINRDLSIPDFLKTIDDNVEVLNSGKLSRFKGLVSNDTAKWYFNYLDIALKWNFNQSETYILGHASTYDIDSFKVLEEPYRFTFNSVLRHDFNSEVFNGSYIGIIDRPLDINCFRVIGHMGNSYTTEYRTYVELESPRSIEFLIDNQKCKRQSIPMTIKRGRF